MEKTVFRIYPFCQMGEGKRDFNLSDILIVQSIGDGWRQSGVSGLTKPQIRRRFPGRSKMTGVVLPDGRREMVAAGSYRVDEKVRKIYP